MIFERPSRPDALRLRVDRLLIVLGFNQIRVEHTDHSFLIDALAIAELLNDFLEFEDLADLVLAKPSSITIQLLKSTSTAGTDPRRLLHVSLWCGREARLCVTTLVDVESQVGLRLQVADHLLNDMLCKFDVDWA